MDNSEFFSRTALMLGRDNIDKLSVRNVAVFGLGGVGGICAEALARSGIGGIDLIDGDRVCPSNINRQIIATVKTIGRYKADVMRKRILDINPNARVRAFKIFYLPETAGEINISDYDYVVDAVDTITAKIELVCHADAAGVPLVSSMGAANKLNPAAFEAADIYETSVCPIARIMRRELRKRGIKSLRVVYSKEPPLPYAEASGETDGRRNIPASNAFVPPAAGLVIAGEVVKGLLGL